MKKAFQFVDKEKANFPVKVMAEVLKVSRTAYYNWAKRPPSARELKDRELARLIKPIHATNRGVYGAPRIHAELRIAHGVRVSVKRVARLMRESELSGLIAKRRAKTTIRVPGVRVADDPLLRSFRVSGLATLKKELIHRRT